MSDYIWKNQINAVTTRTILICKARDCRFNDSYSGTCQFKQVTVNLDGECSTYETTVTNNE